jgi:hypothetical protein
VATFTGPMFNGEAMRIVDRMTEEIATEIGKVAEEDVQARLRTVLRHPTGKYQRRIRVGAEKAGRVVVDDQRSVYGPWLEGTSSRNRTTRFKGYATFRKVLQQVEGKAGQIAQQVVARTVGRLG